MPKAAKKLSAFFKRHSLKAAAGIVGVVLVVSVAGIAVAAHGEPGHLPRGVKAYGVRIGGLTPEEAKTRLKEAAQSFTLTFQAPQLQKTLQPFVSEHEEAPIASLAIDSVVAQATDLANGNQPSLLLRRAKAAIMGANLAGDPKVDEDRLQAWLEQAFAAQVTAPKNPAFVIAGASDGTPVLEIREGHRGEQLLFDLAVRGAKKRIASLSSGSVTVVSVSADPTVRVNDLKEFEPVAQSLSRLAPLVIEAKGSSRSVGASELIGWLTVANGDLSLDREAVEATLLPWSKTVAVSPKNAVFEEKNGKVIAFTPDIPGEGLDIPASLDAITAALAPHFSKNNAAPLGRLSLPMREVPAAITLAQANPYGISEVIGIGESNFAGSPTNRRTNIKVGYTTLNGVIIAPGDTFSLIKTLGAIDASQGYLPELVIKDNKTTPEYGGGLCQIGTTMFRAALDSGLVIAERRNHSYRVPYYERDGNGDNMGPGKDATIYDPSPDLKITNDTGHTVIIQTAVHGDRLTFTLWGQRDGRKAEQTKAVVSNIVSPPTPRLIETTDLPVGQKKCTEKAHSGADATFTYTVTYPSGEVKKTDFFSRYRPWGEVCLIGVDAATLAAHKAAEEAAAAGTVTPPAALPSEDASGTAGT